MTITAAHPVQAAPPEDPATTHRLIGALEASGFDYEIWCRAVGIEPYSDEAEALHVQVSAAYVSEWKRMGERDFTRTLRPIVADLAKRIAEIRRAVRGRRR